ncbi:MAG: alkaline phosphatase family protein [Chloroflexia bacterium]|nr:alkaline phosphatase family protein [Chloroflexia bacterium]
MLKRLLRILLIPLLLLGLGYGTLPFLNTTVACWRVYEPLPLEGLAPGPAREALSERVVVVVVDGLREDTSRQMPALQGLRARGADLPSWTGLPAVSRPGYTALGTGAYPEFSGEIANWHFDAVGVDSLFARARTAGLRTGLVTMVGWSGLYRPWVDYFVQFPWSQGGYNAEQAGRTTLDIGLQAQEALQEWGLDLLYVHFGQVDEAGHAYGGDSPEYLEAALQVDAQIARLAAELDWGRDTLLLTADHGMTDGWRDRGGGHGGAEPESRRIPLVLVGRGILPGQYAEGGQADLVPTVAALLGLPIPSHSQGRTQLEALAALPQQRAELALALGGQQEALYRAYLRALGARDQVDGLPQARAALAAGQYERAEQLVEEYLDRLDRVVARAEANRNWQQRFARLPYLLLPLLALGLGLGLYRPRRELLPPLLFTGLFFLLGQLLYRWGHGGSYSLSTIRAADEFDFFLQRAIDSALVLLVLAVLIGVLWRRRPWPEVLWPANLSVLGIAAALALQLGLFLWLFDVRLEGQLPPLDWGFKFFLDLTAAVVVGWTGVLFAPLALGVSRLFILCDRLREWWGRRGWPWLLRQFNKLRRKETA